MFNLVNPDIFNFLNKMEFFNSTKTWGMVIKDKGIIVKEIYKLKFSAKVPVSLFLLEIKNQKSIKAKGKINEINGPIFVFQKRINKKDTSDLFAWNLKLSIIMIKIKTK